MMLDHLLVFMSSAVGEVEPGLTAVDDPSPILDGTVVDECAWPSVVALLDDVASPHQRCTGTYIGGRIVITAAHCMSSGWTVEVFEDCEQVGCPSMGVYDNVLSLSCDPGGETCSDADPQHSNGMRVALFGEHYQRSPDFHIRRSVQIAYCREFNTQDIPSEPQDFAYCVLMEDPKVQPVPILMHCDVSATLAAGKAVVGVGFGYVKASNPLDAREQGIKRTATGELSGDVLASATTFSTVNWVPGQPTHGDSGGPGFVELSDGTWRQAGVAVDNAETFVTVWPKVQWMLEDPNVDAQAIIPCHTATGQWCPTASCGDFPRSPDVAAGAWGRGAFSCESTDHLGGGGQTCAGGACLRGDDDRSEPWVAAEPNEDAPDPVQVDVAGQDAASCRIDPGRERIGPLLVLVNVLAAARRRRTR